MPPAIFAIPIVPLLAPIAAMTIAHGVPTTNIIKEVEAVTWVPVVIIPAAPITDVIEAIAIITLIVAVISAIGIAVISIVIIAVTGIAQTHIVHTARCAEACRCQSCYFEKAFTPKNLHILHPFFAKPPPSPRLVESGARFTVPS
jgi:hypothetical protein